MSVKHKKKYVEIKSDNNGYWSGAEDLKVGDCRATFNDLLSSLIFELECEHYRLECILKNQGLLKLYIEEYDRIFGADSATMGKKFKYATGLIDRQFASNTRGVWK